MQEPPTITAIADRVGVSHSTVSRVLNGADYRRPAYREQARRIRRVAEQMGYRPNSSARAMQSRRFHAVSLLMSADESRSELPKKMFYGLQAAARAADLTVNLNIVPDHRLTDARFVPKALRELHSDGLLINYHKHPPEDLQRLIDACRVPTVFLNLDAQHDCVRPDDHAAGRDATRRLIELGHRRIAYVGYSFKRHNFHYSEIDRRDGYASAMRDAGLTPWLIDATHAELRPERPSAWDALFASPERPTAVVCYGQTGLTTVHHAAARQRLRVPDDLSLITFSGSPVFNALPIETWLTPEHDVGRVGLETLCHKIDQPLRTFDARLLPFNRYDGQSVGPSPA